MLKSYGIYNLSKLKIPNYTLSEFLLSQGDFVILFKNQLRVKFDITLLYL